MPYKAGCFVFQDVSNFSTMSLGSISTARFIIAAHLTLYLNGTRVFAAGRVDHAVYGIWRSYTTYHNDGQTHGSFI